MSTLTLKDLEDALEQHRLEDAKFHQDMVSSHADLKEVVMRQTAALEEFTNANAPLTELYRSSGFMARFLLRALTIIGGIVVTITAIAQLFKDWGHK